MPKGKDGENGAREQERHYHTHYMTNTSEAMESMNSMTRAQDPLEIDGVVTITVTSTLETQDPYYAKAYPNKTGFAYQVPIYKVKLTSTARPDEAKWGSTLRFTPTQGDGGRIIMAGLADQQSFNSPSYNPEYSPHNSPGLDNGAFSLYGNFLLHGGPDSITSYGLGGKGCVEIVNFEDFKLDIIYMAGRIVPSDELEKMLVFLCKKGRIRIVIEKATRPSVIEVNPPTDSLPRDY